MRKKAFSVGLFVLTLAVLGPSVASWTAEPKTPPYMQAGYVPDWDASRSPAVAVTRLPLIHTSQIHPSGRVIDPNLVGNNLTSEQINDALRQLEALLKEEGAGLKDIVKLNVYVTDNDHAIAAAYEIKNRFRTSPLPAVSYVVTKLTAPHARVAFDAVARASAKAPVVRRWTNDDALKPAVPNPQPVTNSAAVLPVGPRVYISGQAEKGDGSLADATRQTMASLTKTMTHLGISSQDVVQLKAFLTPTKEAAVAVKEMAAAFPEETPPPIVLVEWESSLPIEIELIAAAPKTEQTGKAPALEFITPPWMKPSPVFCRAVRVNHPTTIYISGLYGSTDKPDSADEVRDLFGSLRRIAEQSGSDLKHLAKATYYVSTNEVSSHLNTVRPEFYDPERPPSASKAVIHGTGRRTRTLTLDMIAVPSGPNAD